MAMKRVDEQALSQYLDKRDQEVGNRQPGTGFEGIVTALKGPPGNYQLQLRTADQTGSDGHWYPVQANGQVPQIGDRVQVVWQNEQIGWVTSVLSTSRVTDIHPYEVRLYHNSSPGILAGWVPIVYGAVDYDPNGMASNGNIQIQQTGLYLLILRAHVNAFAELTSGIWRTPLGGSSNQIVEGSYTQNGRSSISVAQRFLNVNDVLTGYVFTGVNNALDGSLNFLNEMSATLINVNSST